MRGTAERNRAAALVFWGAAVVERWLWCRLVVQGGRGGVKGGKPTNLGVRARLAQRGDYGGGCRAGKSDLIPRFGMIRAWEKLPEGVRGLASGPARSGMAHGAAGRSAEIAAAVAARGSRISSNDLA